MSKFILPTPSQEYQLPSSSEYMLPELESYILPTTKEATITEEDRYYVMDDALVQKEYISERIEEMKNMEGDKDSVERQTKISAKMFELFEYVLTVEMHPDNIRYVHYHYLNLCELMNRSLKSDLEDLNKLFSKFYNKFLANKK
jgi:hypothetical protein